MPPTPFPLRVPPPPTRAQAQLDRAILFDDRPSNFALQPDNGVCVRPYGVGAVCSSSFDWEMARLCGVALLALLAPDVRMVLRHFQTAEHAARYKGPSSA